jgi:hypothetical protein
LTPLTALQQTVMQQKGGIKAVAASLDMNYNQFYNHLFEVKNSKMSLNLAYQIEHMCGSLRVATVMAEPLGTVVPVMAQSSDPATALQAVGSLFADVGDMTQEAVKAIADGQVTPREMRQLEAKATKLIADAQALLKACGGLK